MRCKWPYPNADDIKMMCIVVAQNVMRLYVQMCMSILRDFIIMSVMEGWLSVCLQLISFCFSTSQDMIFTALFLA